MQHTHSTSPAGFRRVSNSINVQPVCPNVAGESRAPGVLTKAQAVADWCLCQQDWPISLAPDFLRNAAEPNPAGIHCIHDIVGSNIRVNNPECDSIERNLRWEREERKVLISSTRSEYEFREKTLLSPDLHTPIPHLHTQRHYNRAHKAASAPTPAYTEHTAHEPQWHLRQKPCFQTPCIQSLCRLECLSLF